MVIVIVMMVMVMEMVKGDIAIKMLVNGMDGCVQR